MWWEHVHQVILGALWMDAIKQAWMGPKMGP